MVTDGPGAPMRVVYMAHPLRGDIEGNLAKAKAWIRVIETCFENVAIVASWITECEVWDDADEEMRRKGLLRDMAVISRCHELWLLGERISKGMSIERSHAVDVGIVVRDRTQMSHGDFVSWATRSGAQW